MTLIPSILKSRPYFNRIHIEKVEISEETVTMGGRRETEPVIHMDVRPIKREQLKCPKCGKKCQKYGFKHPNPSKWRAIDCMGTKAYFFYRPQTIKCAEHGVLNEALPWADGDSRHTSDFNDLVAWLAGRMTKRDISLYVGINWRTVGSCINEAWHRVEQDISHRLRNLKRFCIDETSHKVGHKYMTVVYDLDKNQVVWVHDGYGVAVFSEFCELLTEEERTHVELVAGDGARWIDSCVEKYFPNATRCTDPFHVTQWANSALDEVRRSAAAKARAAYRKISEKYNEQQESGTEVEGQISLDEVRQAEELCKTVKGAKYALAHNPENRTAAQEEKIKLIEQSDPDLAKSYQLKEKLRVILHMTDADAAAEALDEWIQECSESVWSAMRELAVKIARHRKNILNSIRFGANSAKSESTNTTIKSLIKMARGFRNFENMASLIYLKCSNIVVPVNARIRMYGEQKEERRAYMSEYRSRKEAERRSDALKRMSKNEPMYKFYTASAQVS